MSWKIDARIPVIVTRTLPVMGVETALLAEQALPEGIDEGIPRAIFRADDRAHPTDCACCSGLGAAAAALAALFRARASGQWFTQVVALARSDEGAAELEDALRRDILTVARFRRA